MTFSTLNVVIGLILVFLLYSLLATTVMELLSGAFAMRGRNLEKALRNMLHAEGDTIFRSFRENPLYQQLAGRFLGKKSPPSYLSAEKFRSVLFRLIGEKEADSLQGQIDQLPEGSLKEVLTQFLEEAHYNVDIFREKVELWFDDIMDRASGWYKRNIQVILIVLGLLIAVAFNVDTLSVYGRLAANPELQSEMVAIGESVTDTTTGLRPGAEDAAAWEEVRGQIDENALGIGWDQVDMDEMGFWDWFSKVFGWFITALAISLGAPFWFDMLRKLVNVRSSGNTPPPAQPRHTQVQPAAQPGPPGGQPL